jgi:hypothetical protein
VLSSLFRRLVLEKLAAAHCAGQLQFFGKHAALTWPDLQRMKLLPGEPGAPPYRVSFFLTRSAQLDWPTTRVERKPAQTCEVGSLYEALPVKRVFLLSTFFDSDSPRYAHCERISAFMATAAPSAWPR